MPLVAVCIERVGGSKNLTSNTCIGEFLKHLNAETTLINSDELTKLS